MVVEAGWGCLLLSNNHQACQDGCYCMVVLCCFLQLLFCNFSNLGCMWEFLQTPMKCQSIYVSVSQVWCVFEDLVYTLQLMKLLIQTCQTRSTRWASKCQSNLKALKCGRLASSPLQISTPALGHMLQPLQHKRHLLYHIMAACCRTNILHNSMAFEKTSFFPHVHNPSEMCQGIHTLEKMCTGHYGHRTGTLEPSSNLGTKCYGFQGLFQHMHLNFKEWWFGTYRIQYYYLTIQSYSSLLINLILIQS